MITKLKVDKNGVPSVQDSKPVYIGADGKDIPVDVVGLWGKIPELTASAKNTVKQRNRPQPTSQNNLRVRYIIVNPAVGSAT